MKAARGTGSIRKVIQSTDRVTLLQFILLVLALTSIGDGLARLITGISSNPALLFALVGTYTGWQLARSDWNAWKSAGITILCGAVVIVLTVGGLAGKLWALVTAIFAINPHFISGKLAVDMGPLTAAWGGLGGTLGGMAARLAAWFQHVGAKPAVSDPLVNGLLWGLVLWLLASWAAWMIRRRSVALPALLPGLALLAWASYYSNSLKSLLALLLVGAELLALQVVQNYHSSRGRWQAAGLEGIAVEPGLVLSVFGLCVGLFIAGALTPSISIKTMADSINKTFERRDSRLAESLGLQPTPRALSGRNPGDSGYITDSHAVSAGPHLPQDLVMTVSVDGYKPVPEIARNPGEVPESPIRYYWRSQTFDHYTGGGWIDTTGQTTSLEAGQPLNPDEAALPDSFQVVTQHVTRLMQGQAVLATGELLRLDQPATVLWHSPGDFDGANTLANAYTAESRLPLVTVETLRKAGSDYPEPILQYYLQLPDDLPARVRNLAFEITINQATPYDKATAIETYLRQFPYTLDVPAPPAGRDVADFFLFELQQGYCDYYATTMVVLARAIGLPARMVVGYSRGIYDEGSSAFIVRANNAHAWVEVYFPGTGWIEFEPTSNQPAIARPHDNGAPATPDLLPVVPAPPKPSVLVRLQRSLDISPGWFITIGVVLLLALLVPLEGWLLNLKKPERGLEIIQQRLYRLGRSWNLPGAGALTPFEFSDALAARLETFAKTPRLSDVIAAIHRDLEGQTSLYACSLYSGRPPSRLESRRAVHAWPGLRRRLWWLRLRFWREK